MLSSSESECWVRRRVDSVVKSEGDSRTYRGLELANGLQVLLINDPETQKSAASLTLNIGSAHDPTEIPGLAHLCEHVLSMGSEKYPEENDFNSFISTCGGFRNAYTNIEKTNYVFDVLPSFFEGGLDRFAQMFISPLFTEAAINAEIDSIESERNQGANCDIKRLYYLQKSLASRNHDVGKFGTGSLKTLKKDPESKGLNVRDELVKFFRENYSANLMSLCVLGAESLDQLSDMVISKFSGIENKCAPELKTLEHPFGLDQTMKRIVAIPVSDWRCLILYFPLPGRGQLQKEKMVSLFMYLLGKSGEGSFVTELEMKKGWMEEFSVDHMISTLGFSGLKAKMFLTSTGLDHVDDILEIFFQYVQLIKQSGPHQQAFDGLRKQRELTFKYKDKEDPYGYVKDLSTSLREYPLENSLSWSYEMTEYDDDLMKTVLERITPENMLYTVVSKKSEGNRENRKERWFGAEHFAEPIPDELMTKLQTLSTNEKLKLPTESHYVPGVLELKEQSKYPVMIKDDSRQRIWHKFDDRFKEPKSAIFLKFTSPFAYKSRLAMIFSKLVADEIRCFLQSDENFGIRCVFTREFDSPSFQLKVSGPSQNQPELVKKVLTTMVDPKCSPERFDAVKDMKKQNEDSPEPYCEMLGQLDSILNQYSWTPLDIVSEEVTRQNVLDFVPKLLSPLHMEGLFYGNITVEDAVTLSGEIQKMLSDKGFYRSIFYCSDMTKTRTIKLPEGRSYTFERKQRSDHKSNAVGIFLQTVPMDDTRGKVLAEFIAQIMKEPAFHCLRTQDRLGYFVNSRTDNHSMSCGGILIVVQGEKNPFYVEARIELFLAKLRKMIECMPAETFQSHVESVVARLLPKHRNLAELAEEYWTEIKDELYNFDTHEKEASELGSVALQDLLNFYDEKISIQSANRRKLCIRIVTPEEKDRMKAYDPEKDIEYQKTLDELSDLLNIDPENKSGIIKNEQIKDIDDFRAGCALYPCPKRNTKLCAPGNENSLSKSLYCD